MIGLSKLVKSLFLASLIPSIINAIIVPFIIILSTLGTSEEMALDSFYRVMFGWVFLGEFVCITCVGYPLFLTFTKKVKSFNNVIIATRNLDYKW